MYTGTVFKEVIMRKETESFTKFRIKLRGKSFKVKTFYGNYRYKCFDCGTTLEAAGKKHRTPAQGLRNGEPICAFCENDRFDTYKGYREQEDLEEALEEERRNRNEK